MVIDLVVLLMDVLGMYIIRAAVPMIRFPNDRFTLAREHLPYVQSAFPVL